MKNLIMKRAFFFGLLFFAFGCNPEKPELEVPEIEGKVTLGQNVPATGLAVENGGGTTSFTFSANKAWTASASVNWLSVKPESGEAGNDISLTVTVQANETGDSRTADITITCEKSTATVPLTQLQNNVMVLENQTFSVAAAGETITLPVRTNVTVTPSSDVAWITVAQTKAVEDHSFSITVAANEAYEEREGHVTFTSDAGNAVITVKQEAAEEPSDGIIRILAIGNSFSQDAVEQYLWNLFDAVGETVIIGNMYIGGCTLETHYNNSVSDAGNYYYRKVVDGTKTEQSGKSLSFGLEDENWNIVTFQQASGKSGIAASYEPYLDSLIAYVGRKAPKAKLYFHQTWAYASSSDHAEFPNYDKNQMTMYTAIVGAVQQALAAHSKLVGVIPSGTAIQNARTSYLGDSFNRDGYHLEATYGRFTAACTWYETLSGKDVTANPWHHSNINDAVSDLCKAAAHAAVAKPFEVTELVDYKKPTVGDPNFTKPVQIDFGGGSSATPEGWTKVAVFKTEDPIYLNNSEGVLSPITITGLEGFTNTYNGVGSEPDKTFTVDGVDFAKGVWSDGIIISGTKEQGDVGPAKIVISGFDKDAKYDFNILSVRWNGSADARLCEYTLAGASRSATLSIYPGLKSDPTTVDMSPYYVTFSEIAPAADGTVTIEVVGKDTTKAVDGLVSALRISKHQ
jgi:hypothetical protein